MRISDLTSSIPTTSGRSSKFQLDAETEHELDLFVEWLVSNTYSTGTAQSYRSYCAKALFMELEWHQMTSDMRCAVKKLREFGES